MGRQRLSTLMALLALLAEPGFAIGQCTSRHHTDIAINMAPGLPLISISAGQKQTTLIFDTGAERTILDLSTVERLGLQSHRAYPRSVQGLTGVVVAGTVDLPLKAGETSLPNHGVLAGSLTLPTLGDRAPDGLLGADILSNFDVDVNLSGDIVRLFDLPSCADERPAWAWPYMAIPANRSLHNHLFFWITVDGHRLAAIFDTGARHSLIDERTARAIGVNSQTLMRDPSTIIHGITGGAIPTHVHNFGRMIIGDERSDRPAFVVTKLGFDDADLVLGVDYLGTHQVWLSYETRQVFIVRAP
ncbi:MAG TPA: retroviral-like aspartic protease family protein [Nitrospira sp.]|nr:retroviral-like aspartic protease family protein [Nitrospira sp.]